jgi:hypothetical protein
VASGDSDRTEGKFNAISIPANIPVQIQFRDRVNPFEPERVIMEVTRLEEKWSNRYPKGISLCSKDW